MANPVHNAPRLFPELRLAAYEADGKAIPAIAIGGDYITAADLEDHDKLRKMLTPLIDLFIAHLEVRKAGGRWAIPENHNNSPSVMIARQLLHFCEQGRAGYRVVVSDDTRVKGRKYLVFQIDKPDKTEKAKAA